MSDDTGTTRHTLHDPIHGAVDWAALRPDGPGPWSVCLFLFGGGGSIATLDAIAPMLRNAWSQGRLPPMLVACAAVDPFCFYLDDAARGMAWETVVGSRLLHATRAHFGTTDRAALVGISMGGYGALKIALERPERFDAVAAIAPMVEPSLRADATPLRNRFHYPPQVPQALLGPERDPELFERDHPGRRAQRNARAIRDHGLAIWLDAGSRDACHAHDGTEALHRVLWDLDIAHDYHLLRDADHVGPSLVPRLEHAFAFVAHHLGHPPHALSPEEQALRDALRPARERAAQRDATLQQTYGRLPPGEPADARG